MVNTKEILVTFNKAYPHLIPKQMFKSKNGYIICAPNVPKGIDYGNPYYYISDDLKTVNRFNMRHYNEFFDALDTKPIWSI